MSGDIEGWLNIVDRLDVWGLAVIVLLGFWKIVSVLNHIERAVTLQNHRVEELEEWRGDHEADDRLEHRRIYDQIREELAR